jgi:hypothetical protein
MLSVEPLATDSACPLFDRVSVQADESRSVTLVFPETLMRPTEAVVTFVMKHVEPLEKFSVSDEAAVERLGVQFVDVAKLPFVVFHVYCAAIASGAKPITSAAIMSSATAITRSRVLLNIRVSTGDMDCLLPAIGGWVLDCLLLF